MTLMTKDEAKVRAATLRKALRAEGQGYSAAVRKYNPNRYEREQPGETLYVVAITNHFGVTLRQVGAE